MKARRRRRLYLVGLILIGVGAAVGLTLNAFNQNLMFFYSPSEIAAGAVPGERMIRLGGLVGAGSVARQADGLTVRFDVTDRAQAVTVEYTGILPDLFREGQGVVAHGRLDGQGLFIAEEVLARHDENYMPPEVADSLQAAHEAGLNRALPGTAAP